MFLTTTVKRYFIIWRLASINGLFVRFAVFSVIRHSGVRLRFANLFFVTSSRVRSISQLLRNFKEP